MRGGCAQNRVSHRIGICAWNGTRHFAGERSEHGARDVADEVASRASNAGNVIDCYLCRSSKCHYFTSS
jgi:hypothetical protein